LPFTLIDAMVLLPSHRRHRCCCCCCRLRLKQFFPFTLIDAMGSLEETRQQITKELRYQSSLDLNAKAYGEFSELAYALLLLCVLHRLKQAKASLLLMRRTINLQLYCAVRGVEPEQPGPQRKGIR
jgi:hypothetical protein